MKKEETKENETNSKVDAIINQEFDTQPRNFNEIVVVLTMEGFDPFIFRFSRMLDEQVKKSKEEFYGMGEEQQKSQTRLFRIGLLSSILLECPQNIPGINQDGDWRAEFTKFLNNYDEFVNWIYGQYQTKLYPKEVLLSLFD